jgi:hypothetical protein
MRSSGFRVIDIIQGWCLVVWSFDHLSLQTYPHHPFCCTCNHTPTTNQIMQNRRITHGWDGEYSKENPRFSIVLSLHPYIAVERQPTTLVHSSLYHWPDDCFPRSHLPRKVTVIWIQRRKQSIGIFSNFQFPAPKTKFVNPHLKVHTTIFNWSMKKSTWCLWRTLREKGIYMSTPSLPEMGTCKQAVLEPCLWLLPGVGFTAANEHLHIVGCHWPWRCRQELTHSQVPGWTHLRV